MNQRPIYKGKPYFAISFVDEEYKLTIVAKNIYPSQYRISTFFCGYFISAISAVYNDTADLKTAEN
jgi:hypothetical protein